MTYFDRALLVIALVGALGGIVGVLVLLRRRVLFAQALTHATFPGAVVAGILGFSLQLGALLACLLLMLVLTVTGRVRAQGAQAASGVLLTAGFASGVLLQALNPQVPLQLDSFLFGSVLSATATDAWLAAAALAATVGALLVWGRPLVFSLFDAEGYRATGQSPAATDALLLSLITLTVIVAMPATGSILTIALLAAPAAAARNLTDSLGRLFWLSPTLGVLAGLAGLGLSRALGTSAGASVALCAAAMFVLTWAWARRSFWRAGRWGVASRPTPHTAQVLS
jgi:zinc/manganese transport system permease protein